MRTNEEILEEWHKVAVKEFHMMEQYQYLVSKWWLSQRLQDLQAIKEIIDGMKTTDDTQMNDDHVYDEALEDIKVKLDELMK